MAPQISDGEVSLPAALLATRQLADNPQEFIAADNDDVGAALLALVERRVGSRRFDLNIIDESTGGVIVINHVQFDAETTWPERLLQLLRDRVGVVRLLGCNTASSELGWAAMLGLADRLKVEVQGTRRPISEGDFDRIGLKKAVLPELWSTRQLAGPTNGGTRGPQPSAPPMRFRKHPPSLDREWLQRYPVATDFSLDQIVKRNIARGIPHDAFPGVLPKRWHEVTRVYARRVFGIRVISPEGRFVVDVLPGGRLLRVEVKGGRTLLALAGRVITESLVNGALMKDPPGRRRRNGVNARPWGA